MKRGLEPVNGRRESVASRLLACLPALVLAELLLAAWAASRALPVGGWSLSVVATAAGNQLLFLLRALPLLCLLAWPLSALGNARWRLLAVGLLWSLFLLLQAGLELYYLQARTLLGSDLFGYSLAEIRTTLGGAGIGVADWAFVLAPLLLSWLLLGVRVHARSRHAARLLAALLLAGAGAWLLPVAVGVNRLDGDAARDIATSKGAYFVADGLHYWRGASGSATASTLVAAQGAAQAAPASLDADYPFLHDDATPDALGPYFNPTRSGHPPNVVVIIVEGLGRSFSGPDAALGSFTPFLDELAARSLYFDNFLANQGRTFGVLPALFGSLPVAEQGFAALGAKMPAHAGLFNVLHRQGYRSAFYNGTDTSFDNERGYLQLQEVDDLVDLRSFGPGYQRNPLSSWGYPDRELVSRVLADNKTLRPPFVLGIQTISMHTSYAFPGQEAYRARFEQRLESLGIPALRRPAYREHADIYSTILYSDDQLRRYFDGVANAPWFADTIFVVTGDHRLPEIPMDSYIERYHVPLLIYSPLLRRPARVRAVSSHLDVTPSLLALLSHTYGLKRPARATWVGTGLDMAAQFRNQQQIPLKHTKTSNPDFISGRWFLHDGQLSELDDGIVTSVVDDAAARAQVERQRDRYLAANAVFAERLALSPEGGMPALVPFDAAGVAIATLHAPAEAAPVESAGIGLDAVRLSHSAGGVEVTATFANGDGAPSRVFAPLAVLAGADGRELHEGNAAAIQLRGHERREVVVSLPAGAMPPGRYFVSVLPSDPDSGKPLGRGRYRIPLDVPGAGQ